MVHELLIQYKLEGLNVEEMIELAAALIEQSMLDMQEITDAVVKECTDGRERAEGREG